MRALALLLAAACATVPRARMELRSARFDGTELAVSLQIVAQRGRVLVDSSADARVQIGDVGSCDGHAVSYVVSDFVGVCVAGPCDDDRVAVVPGAPLAQRSTFHLFEPEDAQRCVLVSLMLTGVESAPMLRLRAERGGEVVVDDGP